MPHQTRLEATAEVEKNAVEDIGAEVTVKVFAPLDEALKRLLCVIGAVIQV